MNVSLLSIRYFSQQAYCTWHSCRPSRLSLGLGVHVCLPFRHNNSRGPSSAAYPRLMTATSTPAHSKREPPLHCLQWTKCTHTYAHAHTPINQLFIVRHPPPRPSPWPEHAFCNGGAKKNKQLINSLSTQSSAFRLNEYRKSGSKAPLGAVLPHPP